MRYLWVARRVPTARTRCLPRGNALHGKSNHLSVAIKKRRFRPPHAALLRREHRRRDTAAPSWYLRCGDGQMELDLLHFRHVKILRAFEASQRSDRENASS